MGTTQSANLPLFPCSAWEHTIQTLCVVFMSSLCVVFMSSLCVVFHHGARQGTFDPLRACWPTCIAQRFPAGRKRGMERHLPQSGRPLRPHAERRDEVRGQLQVFGLKVFRQKNLLGRKLDQTPPTWTLSWLVFRSAGSGSFFRSHKFS